MSKWLDLLITLISINSPNWLALLQPSYSYWEISFYISLIFLNHLDQTSSHACNQQNYCCKTNRSLESSRTSSTSWCLWSWYYRIRLANKWHHLKTVQRIGPSGTTLSISLIIQEIQEQENLFDLPLLPYSSFLLVFLHTWPLSRLKFTAENNWLNIVWTAFYRLISLVSCSS